MEQLSNDCKGNRCEVNAAGVTRFNLAMLWEPIWKQFNSIRRSAIIPIAFETKNSILKLLNNFLATVIAMGVMSCKLFLLSVRRILKCYFRYPLATRIQAKH